jgi:hypothetical protein
VPRDRRGSKTVRSPTKTVRKEFGLDLGGGLRIDRGQQFAFIGEGWFTVVSDVSHFSMMVGAVYVFGR